MNDSLIAVRPASGLAVPWRDPYSVPPEQLASYIDTLERACVENPHSPDVRTMLGIAHAVNHDIPRALEVLEAAVSLDGRYFWAHYKYAEIHYRLRVLNRAEDLSLVALNLATNGWQYSIARKQLQEVRGLKRNAARNLSWSPDWRPLLALAGTIAIAAVTFILR